MPGKSHIVDQDQVSTKCLYYGISKWLLTIYWLKQTTAIYKYIYIFTLTVTVCINKEFWEQQIIYHKYRYINELWQTLYCIPISVYWLLLEIPCKHILYYYTTSWVRGRMGRRLPQVGHMKRKWPRQIWLQSVDYM